MRGRVCIKFVRIRRKREEVERNPNMHAMLSFVSFAIAYRPDRIHILLKMSLNFNEP